MARVVTAVLFVVVAALATTDASPKGYKYVEAAGGHLKYIREYTEWNVAKSTCESDGGILYYPLNAVELEQVIAEMNVDIDYLIVGISDQDSLGDYKTVDGLPLSQVFNKWDYGFPVSNYIRRCGQIIVARRTLQVYSCKVPASEPFICYIRSRTETTIARRVKTVADSSDKIIGQLARHAAATETLAASQNTTLERLLESKERLSQRLENHATTAARNSEILQRQAINSHRLMETLHTQIANQTTILETLAESAARQSTVLERLAESAGAQNTMMGLLLETARNQTTIMTQVLKRLQEDDNSLNQREQ